MTTMAETTGELDMGRVIQELFAMLRRNFATFAILAVVLVGLPSLLAGYLQMSILRQGHLIDWRTVLGQFLPVLGAFILQGTIIYGTVTDLNGRRASVADSLSVGLNAFPPLLGIGIQSGLAIILGCILLIVPGLMIAVAWCVAVPSYVVEQPPLLESFGRSADLTRGNRWRIFALFLLYLVVLIIVEAVAGVFGTGARLAAGGTIPFLQAMVITPLITIANGMIGATGAAVLYVELRRVREGVEPAALTTRFG